MLNIDNEIFLLPIWRYASKPSVIYICVTLTKTADSNKILPKQGDIY